MSICNRVWLMSRTTSLTHTQTHRHAHTHAQRPGCPWTEDRWLQDGSGPGSDDVLYHYNLLRSILPTAALDNMFHPLRADSGTAPPLLRHTYSQRGAATTDSLELRVLLRLTL